MAVMVYGDASWANAAKDKSQAGHVALMAERKVLEGVAARTSMMSWRSHRVKRMVNSAPAAEVLTMSEAMSHGDWLRALWCETALASTCATGGRGTAAESR